MWKWRICIISRLLCLPPRASGLVTAVYMYEWNGQNVGFLWSFSYLKLGYSGLSSYNNKSFLNITPHLVRICVNSTLRSCFNNIFYNEQSKLLCSFELNYCKYVLPLLVPKEWDDCPLQFSQSIGDEQLLFQVFVIHWTLVARLSACEVS